MITKFNKYSISVMIIIAILLEGCNQSKDAPNPQTKSTASTPIIKHSNDIINDGFFVLISKNNGKYQILNIYESRPNVSNYKIHELLKISKDLRFIQPAFDFTQDNQKSKLESYNAKHDYYNCINGFGNNTIESNYNPCTSSFTKPDNMTRNITSGILSAFTLLAGTTINTTVLDEDAIIRVVIETDLINKASDFKKNKEYNDMISFFNNAKHSSDYQNFIKTYANKASYDLIAKATQLRDELIIVEKANRIQSENEHKKWLEREKLREEQEKLDHLKWVKNLKVGDSFYVAINYVQMNDFRASAVLIEPINTKWPLVKIQYTGKTNIKYHSLFPVPDMVRIHKEEWMDYKSLRRDLNQ